MENIDFGGHPHEQDDLHASLLSSASVADVESSLQDCNPNAQIQQGVQLEQDGKDPEQNDLGRLGNLGTVGILLECFKVFRARKAILWRTVFSVGLPNTIAQTALFAATSFYVAFLMPHITVFLHAIGVRGEQDSELPAWGETRIAFWGTLFTVLIVTAFYSIISVYASWWGVMRVGFLIVDWSTIYIQNVENTVKEFYNPSCGCGDILYGVAPHAQVLSLLKDPSSNRDFFRNIYIMLAAPLFLVGYLVLGFAPPNAKYGSPLPSRVIGISLISSNCFALPLSAFVGTTEQNHDHTDLECIWKARRVTRGKPVSAITLGILLYALCIPQIFVIIRFSAWITYGPDSDLAESWVVPLALLTLQVIWGTFNTMVSTVVGSVLYFSCRAHHG